MRYPARTLLAALLLLPLFPRPSAAQAVPGGPQMDWDRARSTFTQDMLRDFNALMDRWRDALARSDHADAARLYGEGAHVVLPDVEVVQGRGAIQKALAQRFPGVVEVRTGIVDFAAADGMTYAMGPFWVQYRTEAGTLQTMIGTMVSVLVRERGAWRIRSQVLRSQAVTE